MINPEVEASAAKQSVEERSDPDVIGKKQGQTPPQCHVNPPRNKALF